MGKGSENGKDNRSVNDLEEGVVMKEKELSLGEEILYQLNEYFSEDEISSIDEKYDDEKYVDRDSSLEIDIFDNIGNITTANAHNGKIISDINYNPDIKYLVTNSVTDRSIIGWTIDGDKILQSKYFKYTDSDFLADLDKKKRFSAHLDDVYRNKYAILRNHYNCYCRVLDLTKGKYLKFPTDMSHRYVKGFFVDNKSKELMMIKEYGSHNSYRNSDQIRFYKFTIDDKTDQLIYKTTYYLYGDEYPSINCKSEDLLIANPNTLITNWDKRKLKYKDDYNILYRYGETMTYNNDKSMVAIVYNSTKRIITFSLEKNRVYSSLYYKKDKTVKKLLFINTENKSEEYLLGVIYCNINKNLEYKLIDPYNLENSMDITDYFNENVLSVSDQDAGVTVGPVVAGNKIIVISNVNDVVTLGGGDSCSSGFSTTTNGSSSINFNAAPTIDTITHPVSINHIYIKEVIDKDKLDMSKFILQPKKAEFLDKKITTLGNVIQNYDPPARTLTLQGEESSVKWMIEYDENYSNIIISTQMFVNENGEEFWRTFDTYDLEAQERFLYGEVASTYNLFLVSNLCIYAFEFLIHDDRNYIHIDEFECKSKIRMVYYREITYKSNRIKMRTKHPYGTIEEKIVNIYGIFDGINKTYVSNKKIPRQPLRETLRNLLNDFYSFEKFGRRILREALDRDNSLIVEEIFNACLCWFERDANLNVSILGGIISELPRMEKHDHKLLSRFFTQTSMLLLTSNPITSNYDSLYTAYTQELFIYKKGSFWRFYYHFIRRVEEIIYGRKNVHKFLNDTKQPAVHLIIPYYGFMSYPTNYSFFDELIYRPASNVFIELEHDEIYKHLTYKAILDFKWNTFGFNYYMGIWLVYTIFLMTFAVATTTDRHQFSEHNRDVLLMNSIVFGSVHFFFEVRQFTWNPTRYVLDFWNCFDLGAYLLPIITSSYWLIHEPPPDWLVSASNLLMDLKFMLFLRGIKYFGSYFAIILGVAKKVFSFLLILFLIIVSFSHALYILLRPSEPYHLDHPDFNDDPNNPWNLVRRYITIYKTNDSYDDRTIFSDVPDGDTNMFTYFHSSLLAMYSFLTGDNSAVAAWSIQEDPYLAILVVIFSFIVVVYLMNLFIGLLSNAIEENNTEEAFLAEKAKIIKEIELFFLFPNQRRWRNWFPEILHYPVSIEDVRKGIKEVDEVKRRDPKNIPFISNELRNLVGMPEPPKKETSILTVVGNRLEENEKKLMKQMQILLDEIKILKNNKDDNQFS